MSKGQLLSQCGKETDDMLDDLRMFQDKDYSTAVNPFRHFSAVKV